MAPSRTHRGHVLHNGANAGHPHRTHSCTKGTGVAHTDRRHRSAVVGPAVTKVHRHGSPGRGVGTIRDVTILGNMTVREHFYRWDELQRITFTANRHHPTPVSAIRRGLPRRGHPRRVPTHLDRGDGTSITPGNSRTRQRRPPNLHRPPDQRTDTADRVPSPTRGPN